jgi:hypothetical protein
MYIQGLASVFSKDFSVLGLVAFGFLPQNLRFLFAVPDYLAIVWRFFFLKILNLWAGLHFHQDFSFCMFLNYFTTLQIL